MKKSYREDYIKAIETDGSRSIVAIIFATGKRLALEGTKQLQGCNFDVGTRVWTTYCNGVPVAIRPF